MSLKKIKNPTKKLTILAVLTALALVSFILEGLLPPLFVPGAKIGISNTFTLFILILYSPGEALFVVAIRTVLGCIFSGNVSAILYSLSAGLVSLACSCVLLRFAKKLSLICVSVVSACIHNTVQLFVYYLFVSMPSVLSYLPVLLIAGILSGFIVGMITVTVIKILPLSFFEKSLGQPSD